jgi:hypothetical protein
MLSNSEARQLKVLLAGLGSEGANAGTAPFQPDLLIRVPSANPSMDILIERKGKRISLSKASSAVLDPPMKVESIKHWNGIVLAVTPAAR